MEMCGYAVASPHDLYLCLGLCRWITFFLSIMPGHSDLPKPGALGQILHLGLY